MENKKEGLHKAQPKVIEIDGKPYERRIFSGDGKAYDQLLQQDNPRCLQRVGTMVLRPLCPVIEQLNQIHPGEVTEQPVGMQQLTSV